MRHNRDAGGRGDAPNLPPDGVSRQRARGNAAVAVHAQAERAAGCVVVMGRTSTGTPVGERCSCPRGDRDQACFAPIAPRDRNLTAAHVGRGVARQGIP
ncbi:MAG TPA: hypothetical protein PKE20_06435 [Promineifilum sp.]|nr:hypothetical protein [Promineifilum sp.]